MPKVPEYNLPKFPPMPYSKPNFTKSFTKSKPVKKAHLKDIDFRKREVRQAGHLEEFKKWYEQLSQQPYSDIIQGQLSMLSAVLWHLLPQNEYKRLVRRKPAKNMQDTTLFDELDNQAEHLRYITQE